MVSGVSHWSHISYKAKDCVIPLGGENLCHPVIFAHSDDVLCGVYLW